MVARSITPTMHRETRVRGRSSTAMLRKAEIREMAEFTSWGKLWLMSCRRVSVSLVYTDMMSPWGWVSKYWMGRGLHVLEELHPQPFHGALGHVYHDAVVGVGAENAHQEHRRQFEERPRQRAEVRGGGLGQGQDVVVDQALHEQVGGPGWSWR